jgi:hypothetical protein
VGGNGIGRFARLKWVEIQALKVKKPPGGQGGFFGERGRSFQRHKFIMHEACERQACVVPKRQGPVKSRSNACRKIRLPF